MAQVATLRLQKGDAVALRILTPDVDQDVAMALGDSIRGWLRQAGHEDVPLIVLDANRVELLRIDAEQLRRSGPTVRWEDAPPAEEPIP